LQVLKTAFTFVVSFSLHSGALLAFVVLKSLSFSLCDAAIVALVLVFAVGFSRSLLWGTEYAVSFLIGAVATNMWLPIALAVFDWAIGGGPSPEDQRFYSAVLRYLFTPEAVRLILAPAAVLTSVALGSFFVGIACRQVLRLAPGRRYQLTRSGEAYHGRGGRS
jgi:hypothetical protein